MAAPCGTNSISLPLPDPARDILPGLPWGRFDEIFTPAFWYCRAWFHRGDGIPSHALGRDLSQEIIACLLGGHGVPAEIAFAAFRRVEQRGLLAHDKPSVEDAIYGALCEPLHLGARSVRYRFPARRAFYISKALSKLRNETPPISNDLALRRWLLEFAGIGPKTASWITRNVLNSDNVAILDIHILRAAILANLFPSDCNVSRDYYELEARLIAFASALNLRLSHLDAVIWNNMRFLRSLALEALRSRSQTTSKLTPWQAA